MKEQSNSSLTQQEIAHVYDELFEGESRLRDTDTFYKWVLNKLDPKPSSKLLDVACGEGLLVAIARSRGVEAFGIDLSIKGAALARKRIPESVIGIANGEYLPFPDDSFEYVTNIGSLEHFLNPMFGVQEMRRILQPEGLAAVILPNSYYLVDIIWQVWRTGYSVSHKQPLERFATFREWWDFLEEGGFNIVRAYKYNFLFPRSWSDFRWYTHHPRKILNLIASPVIPHNLSNHYLYICSKKSNG
jgi:ubiquinone/menaquinone biosynthesis C-methylase UbiE